MTDTGAPAPPRAAPRAIPRWIWLVLIGSLAINLLIVGSVLGNSWRAGHSPIGAFKETAGGGRLGGLRSLPPERRQEVRRIFESRREEYRPLWQDVRRLRREVVRVIETDPFDKQQFIAAMGRLTEAEGRARSAMHPLFADIAATMTASERRAFLQDGRPLRGRGGRGREMDGDGGGGPERGFPGRRER